jgi:uncharacterized lipoprotein YmbA
MKYVTVQLKLSLLLVPLLVIAGCARTLPAQFYVLNPMVQTVMEKSIRKDTPGFTLAIGPVEIPEYLDRPQIITRANEHELTLAEFNKWAEPLDENISRVLKENLTNLLYADAFTVHSWRGPRSTDYRLSLDIIRFDGSLSESVSLVVRWSIFGCGGRKLLVQKTSSYTEPVASPDYEALVSAQSSTLEALSREIADQVRSISQSRAGE